MAAFASEAAWVARVVRHVRELGARVPNPDYLASGGYAPQWRVTGGTLEYRLPAAHGALTIARATQVWRNAPHYEFAARGLGGHAT